jgi:hypothetical protein
VNEALAWILLASKPLMYAWMLALPRLWIPRERRPSRWRPVVGALVRLLLGVVVGLPVSLFLFRFGPWVVTPVMTAVRLGLWFAIVRVCYPDEPWGRLLAISAGATALNWIFDASLFREHWPAATFHFC